MSQNDTRIPEEQHLNVDTTQEDFSGKETLETKKTTTVEVERAASWRYNSGQIYKHTSSAISELGSNAITAVRRAARLFDAWDAGVRFKIKEQAENEVYLIVEDDGIGMSESLIENALGVIGVTTGGESEDVNSTFGRGFYSTYMLCGEEKDDGKGAFELSTNPRFDEDWSEDEPPHNLVCVPGKLHWMDDMSAPLGPDEYGTRIRIPVRDGIDADELEQWVTEFAEYARIPIAYERQYPDGSRTNEELGGNNIESKYDETVPRFTIEEEGVYRAVFSPAADGRLVILDAITETSNNLDFGLFDWWSVDVRLLNEAGAVYQSPDEWKIGRTPKDAADIEDLPEHKRDDYIAKEKVGPQDKQLPKPSGTRDIVEVPEHFIDYLNERGEDKLEENVKEAFLGLDSPEAWRQLTDTQMNIVSNIVSQSSWNDIEDFCESIDASDETRRFLHSASTTVKVVDMDKQVSDRFNPQLSHRGMKAVSLLGDYDNIFMGQSVLQRRLDALNGADGDYAVVQVKAKKYDKLSKIGFTKLTELDSTFIQNELDGVSDETLKAFNVTSQSTSSTETSSSQSVEQDLSKRSITLHYGGYSCTTNLTVETINAIFDTEQDTPVSVTTTLKNSTQRLVVFTSSTEAAISEESSLVDGYTATASCVNKVYDEMFADTDNIIRYEDLSTHNEEYQLLTTGGYKPAHNVLDDEDVALHVVSGAFKSYLEQTRESTQIPVLQRLNERISADGTTAIFATLEDVNAVRQLDEFGQFASPAKCLFTPSSHSHPVTRKAETETDVLEKLLDARLPEWDCDDERRDVLSGITTTDFESYLPIITRLGEMHDSQSDFSFNTVKEPDTVPTEIHTSEGKKNVEQLCTGGEDVYWFAVPEQMREHFSELDPTTLKQTLIERNTFGTSYRRRSYNPDSDSVVVVAPVSTIRSITDRYGKISHTSVYASEKKQNVHLRFSKKVFQSLTEVYAITRLDDPTPITDTKLAEKEFYEGGYNAVELLADD